MSSIDEIVDSKILAYEALAAREEGRNSDIFLALYSLYSLKNIKNGGSIGGGGGSGTVTSVGLSLPSIFNVTNSPVTGSGTLTGSFTSQIAGTVLAAPTGTNGIPAFRALTSTDIPSGINASKIGNGDVGNDTLSLLAGTSSNIQSQLNSKQPLNSNLTAVATIGTALQQIRVNALGEGLEYYTPPNTGVPALTTGQLLVGTSNGVGTASTLSGDATISDIGVLTVNNGAITTAKIADDAVTNVKIPNNTISYIKLANITANSILGRSSPSSGQINAIQASAINTVLNRGTGSLVFSQLTNSHLSMSSAGVLGRSTGAGTAEEISYAILRANLNQINPGSINEGRLTLTSGVPDTSGANVAGATTIFFTPYIGNLIALWNTTETRWQLHAFSQLSLSLAGTTANTNYDVFIYDNAGTLTLEWVAWANSEILTSARAVAINRLNGVWVKSTDSRRYLGTFRTTAAGMTEDSETGTPKCFLQNAVNRVKRILTRHDPADIWTYSGTTFRPTNNNLLNRVEVISGVESSISASYTQNIEAKMNYRIGIGVNSTSVSSATSPYLFTDIGHATGVSHLMIQSVAAGYNYIQMLEKYENGDISDIYGSGNSQALMGLIAEYWA